MRLITLKSCEREELSVKLYPRLMEQFSEPFPGLCGILSSVLRLTNPSEIAVKPASLTLYGERSCDTEQRHSELTVSEGFSFLSLLYTKPHLTKKFMPPKSIPGLLNNLAVHADAL